MSDNRVGRAANGTNIKQSINTSVNQPTNETPIPPPMLTSRPLVLASLEHSVREAHGLLLRVDWETRQRHAVHAVHVDRPISAALQGERETHEQVAGN